MEKKHLLEEEQKVEKDYLLKLNSQMIKFKSLNQSKDFIKILKKKRLNTKYFTIYFDKDLKKLAKDMIETMHATNGIGIAAPQVGVNARIFISAINSDTRKPKELVCVNPEVLYRSPEQVVAEEGCLSLPQKFGNVKRASEIFVRFYDLKGKEQNLRLTGMDARVFLHELDFFSFHIIFHF